MFRSFAKRVACVLDLGCLGLCLLNLGGRLIISFWTVAFMRVFCSRLLSLLISSASAIPTDLVQSFHGPFNHMERINAAFAVRSKLVYTVGDPVCTVAGDDLDTGRLLIRQSFVELLENRSAVAVSYPDHDIGVVVNNDGDVLMPLAVAGLIDTDADKAIQPSGTFRFKVLQTSEDTSSDCLPVDAHEVRHGASGQIFREPSDGQVKLFCKAASRISPRNCSRDNTILRTAGSVSRAFNLYQNAAPVQFSPHLCFSLAGHIPDSVCHRRDSHFYARHSGGP